jgi:hypothetical protein
VNVGAAVVVHLEGGGAWFFGCRLDLLIEEAWRSVLAVVELVVTWEAWSSCRKVCSGRKLGD